MSEKQPVRLKLPPVGGSPDALIEIDGKDITDRVDGVTVEAGVNQGTRVFISYTCQEGVDIDGEAFVHHVCPLEEPSDA